MSQTSLGTDVQMCVTVPITGSGNVQVNADNYFIFNIPKSADRCVFGPIVFYVLNQMFKTIGLGGSCGYCFHRLEVFHSSNVLEQIDQYNNSFATMLNSQVNSYDRSNQWSV